MKPIIYIVTGNHTIVRNIIQDFVTNSQDILFFSSLQDYKFYIEPPSDVDYYEKLLSVTERRDADFLNVLNNGVSIITEQWYLGIITQIKSLQKSLAHEFEERANKQMHMFNHFSKKVLYVSESIEDYGVEIDINHKERYLSSLSGITKKLNLHTENINGDDTVEYVKKRTLFLLEDSNNAK